MEVQCAKIITLVCVRIFIVWCLSLGIGKIGGLCHVPMTVLVTFCFYFRCWLDKFPNLIPMTAYTFLRVIVDHTGQIFNNLRQREVEFTATLMRDKVNRVTGTLVNLHVAICQKFMIFLLCIITKLSLAICMACNSNWKSTMFLNHLRVWNKMSSFLFKCHIYFWNMCSRIIIFWGGNSIKTTLILL